LEVGELPNVGPMIACHTLLPMLWLSPNLQLVIQTLVVEHQGAIELVLGLI
jgi:hypothetical protein